MFFLLNNWGSRARHSLSIILNFIIYFVEGVLQFTRVDNTKYVLQKFKLDTYSVPSLASILKNVLLITKSVSGIYVVTLFY